MVVNGIETSCGAVVFTKEGGEIKYVIIESTEGFHGFPKGHIEAGESELDAAYREIAEETGLSVDFIDGFRMVATHKLPKKPGVIKRVVYFLATCSNQELKIQEEELNSAGFYTYDEAMALFEFENTKEVLAAARDFIEKNNISAGDL